MRATIVDGSRLLRLVAASVGAGVGVTLAFSLVIYGLVRANEMRRSERTLATSAYGLVALIGLAVCAGVLVYGFLVMIRKS